MSYHRYRAWFFVFLFLIVQVQADKTSPSWSVSSVMRQQSGKEYVMLTLCQDSMCEQVIDLEWECLFQWQVCTFMPQMESYFWFEKTSYGKFYRVCEDWMCLNCSLCGAFEEYSTTCIPLPYFNAYGRLEQVEWASDPPTVPTTTSTTIPSTSAQPDPPSATATPTAEPSTSPTPTATSVSTDIPKKSNSGGNQKIGDKNATSRPTPTPKPSHTNTTSSSPQQSQPASSKIHQSSGGLSGGSIAGIVIGSTAGGLAAVGLTTLYVRRRRALRTLRTT
jgi:hypothetical protein